MSTVITYVPIPGHHYPASHYKKLYILLSHDHVNQPKRGKKKNHYIISNNLKITNATDLLKLPGKF